MSKVVFIVNIKYITILDTITATPKMVRGETRYPYHLQLLFFHHPDGFRYRSTYPTKYDAVQSCIPLAKNQRKNTVFIIWITYKQR